MRCRRAGGRRRGGCSCGALVEGALVFIVEDLARGQAFFLQSGVERGVEGDGDHHGLGEELREFVLVDVAAVEEGQGEEGAEVGRFEGGLDFLAPVFLSNAGIRLRVGGRELRGSALRRLCLRFRRRK